MTVPTPRRSTSPQTRGLATGAACGDPAIPEVLSWTVAVGPPRFVSARCPSRHTDSPGSARIPDPRDPLA